MLKNCIIFILLLLPWFIASAFPIDYNYYDSLNLPFFAPPKLFYGIAWPLVYILITISIFQIINSFKLSDIPKSYKITLFINYLFNQSYTIIGFGLKNNFLGFVSCLGTFISCLFLVVETKELKEKSTMYLLPYVLLSFFATILSFSIYIMNI